MRSSGCRGRRSTRTRGRRWIERAGGGAAAEVRRGGAFGRGRAGDGGSGAVSRIWWRLRRRCRRVVTAVGLDLQHLPDEEPALEPGRPIGAQRRGCGSARRCASRRSCGAPVRWAPGFHACDAPWSLAGLYLVHLRYADLALGLRRLARTRGQAFARAGDEPASARVRRGVRGDGAGDREAAARKRFVLETVIGAAGGRGWSGCGRRGRRGAGWLTIGGGPAVAVAGRWRALF